MNIDYSSLDDVYHLSMIIIGFGGLILGWITLVRNIKKEKQYKALKQKRKY